MDGRKMHFIYTDKTLNSAMHFTRTPLKLSIPRSASGSFRSGSVSPSSCSPLAADSNNASVIRQSIIMNTSATSLESGFQVNIYLLQHTNVYSFVHSYNPRIDIIGQLDHNEWLFFFLRIHTNSNLNRQTLIFII